MTTTVFLAVLLAAALHATWNAMVKGSGDKALAMLLLVAGQGAAGALALLFAPPLDAAALPFLLATTALHCGYQIFLVQAYRTGDLTQVYPIARGSAPLMVALISAVFLGVTLPQTAWLAVALIGGGIVSLALTRREEGLNEPGARNPKAVMLALATGGFITAYSLVDGYGARAGGTGVGFFAWAALLNVPTYATWVMLSERAVFARVTRPAIVGGAMAGMASFAAYAIVVWAFTQAPIALVTALRETSIVFSLLIGVFVLREKLDLAKLASTATTLAGVALLRFARPS